MQKYSVLCRRCLLVLLLLWAAGAVLTAPLGIYRSLLSTARSLTETNYDFEMMVANYQQVQQPVWGDPSSSVM